MKKAEKAFTLVELLVVISIIAILLAILMPALSKVKEQGRTVVCGTNLKNYGIAMQMYANSSNDRCPDNFWLYSKSDWAAITGGSIAADGTLTYGSTYSRYCVWHYEGDVKPAGGLFKYLQDKNINSCPTFKTFAMAGGLNGCPSKNTRGHSRMPFAPGFSYSMNASLYLNWGGGESTMSISSVKRSQECIAFSEENLWPIGCTCESAHPKRPQDNDKIYSDYFLNDNCLWLSANESSPNYSADNLATYHKVSAAKRDYGYAEAVYIDGHVDSVKGVAGYDAYLTYGRPYYGHEKIAKW